MSRNGNTLALQRKVFNAGGCADSFVGADTSRTTVVELEDDDDALLLAAVSERQLLLDIVEYKLCLVGSTGRGT